MEEEEIHLSQKHRFEMVWSRTRSLEKIDLVTQPSKDPGELQGSFYSIPSNYFGNFRS